MSLKDTIEGQSSRNYSRVESRERIVVERVFDTRMGKSVSNFNPIHSPTTRTSHSHLPIASPQSKSLSIFQLCAKLTTIAELALDFRNSQQHAATRDTSLRGICLVAWL